MCYNTVDDCKDTHTLQIEKVETFIHPTTPWEKIEEKPIYSISEHVTVDEKNLYIRHQCLPN